MVLEMFRFPWNLSFRLFSSCELEFLKQLTKLLNLFSIALDCIKIILTSWCLAEPSSGQLANFLFGFTYLLACSPLCLLIGLLVYLLICLLACLLCLLTYLLTCLLVSLLAFLYARYIICLLINCLLA